MMRRIAIILGLAFALQMVTTEESKKAKKVANLNATLIKVKKQLNLLQNALNKEKGKWTGTPPPKQEDAERVEENLRKKREQEQSGEEEDNNKELFEEEEDSDLLKTGRLMTTDPADCTWKFDGPGFFEIDGSRYLAPGLQKSVYDGFFLHVQLFIPDEIGVETNSSEVGSTLFAVYDDRGGAQKRQVPEFLVQINPLQIYVMGQKLYLDSSLRFSLPRNKTADLLFCVKIKEDDRPKKKPKILPGNVAFYFNGGKTIKRDLYNIIQKVVRNPLKVRKPIYYVGAQRNDEIILAGKLVKILRRPFIGTIKHLAYWMDIPCPIPYAQLQATPPDFQLPVNLMYGSNVNVSEGCGKLEPANKLPKLHRFEEHQVINQNYIP